MFHFQNHFQKYAFTSLFCVSGRCKFTDKCVQCLLTKTSRKRELRKPIHSANGYTNHTCSCDRKISIRAGFPLLTIGMYGHFKLLLFYSHHACSQPLYSEGSCPMIVDLRFSSCEKKLDQTLPGSERLAGETTHFLQEEINHSSLWLNRW